MIITPINVTKVYYYKVTVDGITGDLPETPVFFFLSRRRV